MKIDLLRAHNLRCFDALEIVPGPRLNWLVGPNGAGKTSLLEGIHTLSHGRSFRAAGREAMARRGQSGYDIYAELRHESGSRYRLGMARENARWQIRVDGIACTTLQPLLESCAVVCFEPGSHGLIVGHSEERRRFLNWGVFHVEHDSLTLWRDYRRVLRQRNTLLREQAPDVQFEPWEREMERYARLLEAGRKAYVESLVPNLRAFSARFLSELGEPRFIYRPGWDPQEALTAQLAEQRDRDRQRGHTRHGPHRADWALVFEHAPGREYLSRGQTKLVAMICVLAQAAQFAEHAGEWPILCIDDLGSELDAQHQEQVLQWLTAQPVQAWITATAPPADSGPPLTTVFHVEHGTMRCIQAPVSRINDV
ncbi:MAG: DNA replication/repair protein RecF [Rhodanobacteraceae bacterium]